MITRISVVSFWRDFFLLTGSSIKIFFNVNICVQEYSTSIRTTSMNKMDKKIYMYKYVV